MFVFLLKNKLWVHPQSIFEQKREKECIPLSEPQSFYEGHSGINDNELISKKVLLNLVSFVMPHVDTYISYSCLKFGAFIMARFVAMIILI